VPAAISISDVQSFSMATKSALEGLTFRIVATSARPEDGWKFPLAAVDDLRTLLRPVADGGLLNKERTGGGGVSSSATGGLGL